MTQEQKRVLLFATKLGYQTRSFRSAADQLGVTLAYVTDRCGRLDDPWNDQALAVHFGGLAALAAACSSITRFMERM